MSRPTLKYTNLLIIYDAEDSKSQLIFRQRIFSSDRLERTPITQKLLERAIVTPFAPRVRAYKPREFVSLQRNQQNINNTSRFKVIAPYLPASEDFKKQAKEILALDRVECIEYLGEDRR